MLRALVMSICIAVTATPVLADSKADQQKAKQLYEEGLSRYNLAEYQKAITAWKESYLLSKAPLLLFNIGQAFRLSGDCKQAMRFYENYRREAPNPRNRAELEDAIELCAKAPVKPVKPDPVKPDPVKPDPVKPDPVKPDPVKPDPVKPDPVKPDPVKPDPITTANIGPDEPDEPDEPEAPGPTRPGRTMRIAGIATGGAGALLGGAAIYFALQSQSASKDLDGYRGEWGQAQIDLEAKGKGHATKAWVLGAAGAAAIVAGGVLYYLGTRAGNEAPAETVGITPTNGGLEVSYVTRF